MLYVQADGCCVLGALHLMTVLNLTPENTPHDQLKVK